MSRGVWSLNKLHDLRQRRAGEENLIHAASLHQSCVRRRDRAAATAEDADVLCARAAAVPSTLR